MKPLSTASTTEKMIKSFRLPILFKQSYDLDETTCLFDQSQDKTLNDSVLRRNNSKILSLIKAL